MELQFDENGNLTDESRLKRSALTKRILDRLGLAPNKPKKNLNPKWISEFNKKG
jgi:hypothetical protein